MSTFVLIHGGWAGGWVWENLVPILEGEDHHVLTPDLPGHGDDHTPVAEITLERYVERVLATVDAAAEPVILVGHSSGGVVITQAAEHRPDRIALLVYLCAYLPGDGQSLFALGQSDTEGLILPNLVVSENGATATIRPEVVHEALFADCSEEEDARFAARAVPEPLAVATTPVQVTPKGFGRVPRAYITCRRDRAVSPALQERMFTAVPCDPVVAMDTGHMPQYAAPVTLAAHLSALAGAAPDRRAAVHAQDFR